MNETLTQIQQYITVYGFNILAALVIFAAGRWATSLITQALEKVLLTHKVEATLAAFARNMAYYGLLTFVILAALGRLGVQTASFVAVVGAAGFAVGMALQGSLSNFAAGVMIILFKPFKAGDVVTVCGVTGLVKEIDIFNTILCTGDNIKIVLPNSQVTGSMIQNLTANGTRRVDLEIGIAYEDDLREAKKILEDLLAAHPKILKDPKPLVAVSSLGESSVNLAVRPWARVEDYWDVYFSVLEAAKLTFDERGIHIPYPQRDLHIKTDLSELGKLTKAPA